MAPDEPDPIRTLVHDLRTPLAVVAGFAELLEKRAADLSPQQTADYVARISAGARQLGEILDATKPSASTD